MSDPLDPAAEILEAKLHLDLELETIKVLYAKMLDASRAIETSVQNCGNLLRQAQRAADAVRQAANPAPAPSPVLRDDKKATIESKGPRAVLEFLALHHPRAFTVERIANAVGYSESTVRTYIPILKEDGLISCGDGAAATLRGLEYHTKNRK